MHDNQHCCDRFEAEWKAGKRPKIEGVLKEQPEALRSELFRDLLLLEWRLRSKDSQQPTVSEYCDRFPIEAPQVRQILSDVDRENDSLRYQSTRILSASEGERIPSDEEIRKPSSDDLDTVRKVQQIGRYQIIRLLGQGGFGQVFLAKDGQLQRDVAIKVAKLKASSQETAEEYLAEARTLAELDHPHIVPVYDVGNTQEHACFIVSKFIEGSDLAKAMVAQRFSQSEMASLIACIADALHFAHGKKIIHRDIKPGNILLDTSGRPYVTDFGLALKNENFGKSSAIMGTPAYMSPEQARGESNLVDGRSDIYSLGVVLYELLTGELPFSGSNWDDFLHRIVHVEARPPRQINDQIPIELEKICLKAMAKTATLRYTTAHDLAEDLRQFADESEGGSKKRSSWFTRKPVTGETVRDSHALISCAQLDDEPLAPEEEGWVSQFHHNLEVRLAQLMGESIKVLCLPSPSGPSAVDPKILKELPAAKTVVSVLSPPFAKSNGCHQIAAEFWKSAERQGQLWVDGKPRYFPVIKTPVADTDLPGDLVEHLSAVSAFSFFEKDVQTGRIREFDERFGIEARQRYFERVYDLAHDMSSVLKALDRAGSLSTEHDAESKTVYLAACSSDLQDEHDRIRRELVSRGHHVLPDQPLPLVSNKLETCLEEQLARCDLAIHLVGSTYGIIPEGASASIVELQNRYAANFSSKANLPRIIWIPPHLQTHDDRQREFLEQIRQDSVVQAGAEVVQDTLESLKQVVLGNLKPPQDRSHQDEQSANNNAPRIYLICDRKDEDATETLEDFLFEQGFEVSLPDFDADEEEGSELHRQNLIDCDGVIVFFGAVRHSWVDIKLRNVMKASGYGRTEPIAARAVYIAPPVDRRKERFKSHLAGVIRQDGEFDASLLADFIKQLKSGSESDA